MPKEDYNYINKIGSGAFGTAWLAEDKKLKKQASGYYIVFINLGGYKQLYIYIYIYMNVL